MFIKSVIACTNLQPETHTLWVLREVRERYALIAVAISCKVAQFMHSYDSVDSLAASPIMTHIGVDQSLKT